MRKSKIWNVVGNLKYKFLRPQLKVNTHEAWA